MPGVADGSQGLEQLLHQPEVGRGLRQLGPTRDDGVEYGRLGQLEQADGLCGSLGRGPADDVDQPVTGLIVGRQLRPQVRLGLGELVSFLLEEPEHLPDGGAEEVRWGEGQEEERFGELELQEDRAVRAGDEVDAGV